MSRGHIRRRGRQSWELKFDAAADPLTGRRRVRYVSFKGTRREAGVEIARLVAMNAAGQGVDPSRETVADFLARWQEWARDNVAPKTAERYGEIIKNNVSPHIGALQIQRLRPAHLVELYATLGRSGGRGGESLAPRTIGHVHRLLRRALGHAVTWDVTANNPAASVKPPRVPDDTEVQILSEAEVGALLRALNGRTLRAIVSFLLGTGCRRGEALALRWSDVDFDNAVVRIERSLEQTKAGLRFKSPKTRAGRRAVTISPWLVAELRAHRIRVVERRLALGMGALPDNALVFGKWDSTPRAPHTVTTQFRLACAPLGIKCTLHALRHTHVSQLIASGLDVLTIGRRVGHSSAAVTLNVYGHLIAGQDAKAAAVMEKAFGRVHDTN